MNASLLVEIAVRAAEKACREILTVYYDDNFQVELKGDQSPLTRADKLAHEAIIAELNTSGYPVLSEEGRDIPFSERKAWEYFWMVDPLDGTKEFIKRNDEFTVNIALIHKGRPVLGVVAVPVTGDVYLASAGAGATLRRDGKSVPLSKRPPVDLTTAGLKVVASRSHMSSATEDFINKLNKAELVSAGSSLKFMLLAEGKADVYPRFGPTMEWDTAAAHIIVNEVGMKVYSSDGNTELLYNKENLLNPDFLVK
ncbi:3'(2'),5'-bisphosphate nucleotidase CysQ [Chryseolinea sp. T2]|uniref:3'(2'),5'-bisphosphate nucleotidase CysQ n=1 Tax=Chryseolinea sp. T2 TaxID=3129255 RepID=UPI0030782FD5